MEKQSNEKKVLIFSTIAVVLLIVVVVGATYAFFTAQGGASANTNVNVQTNTTDNLSFSVGEPISITANQDNFAQGLGNQADSTTASATLTANNATNTATANYYLYLDITSNDFEYTVDDNTPELILTITDPDGTELQTLSGYQYVTVDEVSGFDITTVNDVIKIAENYEITSTGTETQEWNITITFVNLDSDQEGNTNKTFEATLVIREDSPIGITNVSASNITSDSITLTVNAESENTITNYYFAKNEEEYVNSASNTYTFTGLDAETEYTLKAYAVDDEGYQSAVYSTEVITAGLTLAELCSDPTNSELLSCQVYTQYGGVDGSNGIYFHDGIGDYVNVSQEASDNSYRFSGGDYQVTSAATQAGLVRAYTAVNTETDGVINFYCNGSKQYVGFNCSTNYEHYYTTTYNETAHYSTLEEALNQAVTDGYLTSDNIKNFVCFGPGASEEKCPEENLYRIIGVFDNQVKLIKYTYADPTILGSNGNYNIIDINSFWSGMRKNANTGYRYYWNNSTRTNTWKESGLNTVNLNTNYWNYLTSEWQNLIAESTWQVGGNTSINIASTTAKNTYTNEIVSPAASTTYQDEIGLMYVSDYMYAVDSQNWTKVGYSSNGAQNDYRGIKGDNWMYMGFLEWTISSLSDTLNSAFYIRYLGSVHSSTVDGGTIGVRPVFYLNSDVEIYEGHSGTQSDPYRIVI